MLKGRFSACPLAAAALLVAIKMWSCSNGPTLHFIRSTNINHQTVRVWWLHIVNESELTKKTVNCNQHRFLSEQMCVFWWWKSFGHSVFFVSFQRKQVGSKYASLNLFNRFGLAVGCFHFQCETIVDVNHTESHHLRPRYGGENCLQSQRSQSDFDLRM